MNENKTSLGKMFVVFLLFFFFAIVLFVSFAIFNITDYKVFPAVLTFLLINFIILLVIIGGGNEIVNKIGAASYTSICVVSAIYTLLQFLQLGFRYQSNAINGYVLYQLILLFIYLLIIIPTLLMGAKNNSK